MNYELESDYTLQNHAGITKHTQNKDSFANWKGQVGLENVKSGIVDKPDDNCIVTFISWYFDTTWPYENEVKFEKWKGKRIILLFLPPQKNGWYINHKCLEPTEYWNQNK